MNKLTEHFFLTSTNVFTQAEVALVIGGSDFSRHALIKRALEKGEILSIRRGLYCLAKKYRKKPLSVYVLAERIYGPSYVSLETALSYHGWIPEAVHICNNVSYHAARQFETPLGIYSYRTVPQNTFYSFVERLKDESGHPFFMATPEKALADYVYLQRPEWSDIEQAAGSLRIEEEHLISANPENLVALRENYRSSRVRRFLDRWMKALQT